MSLLARITSLFRASPVEPANDLNATQAAIDDVVALLAPWRAKHARVAWLPVVVDTNNGARTWFGGAPSSVATEAWPVCNGCDKPMRFMLQLSLADLPAALDVASREGIVQFFYCATDDGSCETWRAFSGTHRVRLVNTTGASEATAPAGTPVIQQKWIAGWNATEDFPAWDELEALGIHWDSQTKTYSVDVPELSLKRDGLPSAALERATGETRPGDKLGGWPYWIQAAEYPSCPTCNAQMVLLFQVDSENNLDVLFGDTGCGHITQCRAHADILTFAWACT